MEGRREKEDLEAMFEERNNGVIALEKMVNSLLDPRDFESSISQYKRQFVWWIRINLSDNEKKQLYLWREFNDFIQAYAALRAYQEKSLKE